MLCYAMQCNAMQKKEGKGGYSVQVKTKYRGKESGDIVSGSRCCFILCLSPATSQVMMDS